MWRYSRNQEKHVSLSFSQTWQLPLCVPSSVPCIAQWSKPRGPRGHTGAWNEMFEFLPSISKFHPNVNFHRGFELFSVSLTTLTHPQTMPFCCAPTSLPALTSLIQKVLLILPLQHFLMKNLTYIEKLNGLYSEHSYTHHLESTVNILLCLLYHAFQSELQISVHFTPKHFCMHAYHWLEYINLWFF